MSSTRNRNCQGDYILEQTQKKRVSEYSTYANSAYGHPIETQFAGDGLLMGRMANINLSHNACDIESQLLGIGSTNLVVPKQSVSPDIKTLMSLNVIDRLSMLVPEPLVVEKNQRPYLNF